MRQCNPTGITGERVLYAHANDCNTHLILIADEDIPELAVLVLHPEARRGRSMRNEARPRRSIRRGDVHRLKRLQTPSTSAHLSQSNHPKYSHPSHCPPAPRSSQEQPPPAHQHAQESSSLPWVSSRTRRTRRSREDWTRSGRAAFIARTRSHDEAGNFSDR